MMSMIPTNRKPEHSKSDIDTKSLILTIKTENLNNHDQYDIDYTNP